MNNSKSVFNRRLLAIVISFALVLVSVVGFTLLRSSDVAHADDPTGNWTDSGNYDTSWYDENGSEFTLATPAWFAGFAYLVNNGNNFSEKTIKLGADIDLNGHYWTPIGKNATYFGGTFDGQNHTISHMTVNTNVQNSGLFGYVYGATIRNVILASSCLVTSTTSYVGGIAGYACNGSIKNVINKGTVIGGDSNSNMGRVGGIVGYADRTLFENVTNDGEVTGRFNDVGGIVGYVYDGVSIADANNSGTIENDIDVVGGIVGYVDRGVSITGVDNTGEIKGRNGVGGIVGTIYGSVYSNVSVENVTNGSAVTGIGSNVGGIVGCIENHCNLITGAVNTGTITGVDNVGGLVGLVYMDRVLVICNSYNRGIINSGILATETYKGGLVGKNNCRMTIVNCYNAYCIMPHENNIDGNIVGNNSGKLILENVYYNYDGVSALGINVENEGATYSGTATGMSDTDMKGAIDVSSSLAYKLNEYAGGNNNIYEIDSTEYILRNWKVSSNDYPMLAITIVYKLNGGTGSLPEPNYTYNIDDEITLPSGITKPGNKFVGWNDGTSTYDAGAPYTIKSETVVFTAQWLPMYWTYENNYETSWYVGHESDTVYTLTTPEQFAGFAYLVNNGNNFSGKTIKLNNDIDLLGTVHNESGVFWTPIGTYDNYFAGTFDGQEHTISNMTVNATVDNSGLFGCVSGATIRNVILDSSCSVTSTANNVGGIAGVTYNETLIENVVNNGNVSGTSNYVGGIVGYAYDGAAIKNASNTGGNVSGYEYVGGIVGAAQGGSIENVINSGTISGTNNIGGIVGFANDHLIKNAVNTGIIRGNDCVGGICGQVIIGVLIENANNDGIVTVTGNSVGGIIGYIYYITKYAELLNCNNSATITGNRNGGGLVGAMIASMSINNSHNTGNINAEENSGGIVGIVDGGSSFVANIVNSYNTGAITGGSNNGGIIGYNGNATTILSSYNTGAIIGESNNGGIIGNNSNDNSYPLTIVNSYNAGVITGESNSGGIVGRNAHETNIVNSYNAGAIIGEGNNGSIFGNNISTATVESVYYLEGISEIGNSNEGSTYTGTATPMSDVNMKGELNDTNSLVYKLNAYVDEHPTYTVATTEYELKLWNVMSNDYPTFEEPPTRIEIAYTGGYIVKGEKIQGDKLQFTVIYEDGSTLTIAADDENISYWVDKNPIKDPTNYVFDKAGEVKVTVKYKGKETEMTLTVVDDAPTPSASASATSTATPTATATATAETSDGGLSIGAIAGIVIGALILLGVMVLLIYFDQVKKK